MNEQISELSMPPKTLPKTLTMLTVAQAAKFLGITRQAVWQAVENGRLKRVEYGGVSLITRASLLAYEKTRRPGGPATKKQNS